MTKTSAKQRPPRQRPALPSEGGCFVRQKDGKLAREGSAPKPAKQPLKKD